MLPVDNPENFPPEGNRDTQLYPLNVNTIMEIYKKRGYPKKHLTFIGNQPDDRGMPCYKGPYATFGWDYMEEWLYIFYDSWREYNWEIKDGQSYVRRREHRKED